MPIFNAARCQEKIEMVFNEESLLKQSCLKEIESVIIKQEPGFSEELCDGYIETNIKIEPQEETLINDESLHTQEDINTRLIIKQEPGFSEEFCDDNIETKIKLDEITKREIEEKRLRQKREMARERSRRYRERKRLHALKQGSGTFRKRRVISTKNVQKIKFIEPEF